MGFSDYLAILAVLISAFSLYISWRQYQRDRSHLASTISLQNHFGELAYHLSLVNNGRRMTTVQRIYALVRSGKRYPVFDTPTQLGETKTLELSVPLMDFGKAPNDPDHIVAFEVEDSTGNNYRFSTRRVSRKTDT